MNTQAQRGDAEYWDLIEAWLAGELPPTAVHALEQRAAEEAEFAHDVAEWNAARAAAAEWVAADPPGLAHALAVPLEALQQAAAPTATIVPMAATPPRQLRRLPAWWRTAAAAALLLLGFGLGRMTGVNPAPAPEHPAGSIQARVSEPLPRAPTPQAAPLDTSPSAPPAPQSAPVRKIDDQGRIIVEAALHGSGGRATWIIDGNFELASSANH